MNDDCFFFFLVAVANTQIWSTCKTTHNTSNKIKNNDDDHDDGCDHHHNLILSYTHTLNI